MKNIRSIFLIFLFSFCFYGSYSNNISKEKEVILKTNTGDISGTLIISDTTKTTPIILIIPGSGPTDRDCNSPGIKTNAYKKIAEELSLKGISSLRYDKRGIGKSKGSITSEYNLRFDDYVNDAIEWVSLLKSYNYFSKIFIVGHSEGSLIGMIVAQKIYVNGFISIEGAGKSADKLILQQLNNQPQIIKDEAQKILDSLLLEKKVEIVSASLQPLFRPSVQPYMISWIKYNPETEIAKVKIPILIIQGTTDIQVSLDDANLLKKGAKEAKIVIIEKMNHILKESESDIQKNLSTYNNPELPIKKELIDEINNFILKN